MFESLKGWLRRMLGYTTLKKVVGKDLPLTEDMIEHINLWKAMLNGSAPWVDGSVISQRLEGSICREFVDCALSEIEVGTENDKLNEVIEKMLANLNESMQCGLALGSMCIKPLGVDTFEFVFADSFVPIAFNDDGVPVDLAFLTRRKVGDNDYYTKFERHYFIDDNLTIETKCFHSSSSDEIGNECPLSSVEQWEDINPGPITYKGMTQNDYGYFKTPIRNYVDESKCGASIYHDATDHIKEADIRAAQISWEYESGERAIHVDSRALKQKGQGIARLNKRLYRGLNLDAGKDTELLKEYSPEMRDEAFIRGYERKLRDVEFCVGLAYGDLSNVSEVEKTAEEIKSSKIRKFNRVTAIQNKLKPCLEDFVAGLAFYNGVYTSNYDFVCKFHDSIQTDEDKERSNDRQDLAAGIMSPEEYRAKWYGETEEEAREKINGISQNNVME